MPNKIRQALCGLTGHDDLTLFNDPTIDARGYLIGVTRLECQTCGRKTPGWHHETKKIHPPRAPFLERLARALNFGIPTEGERI